MESRNLCELEVSGNTGKAYHLNDFHDFDALTWKVLRIPKTWSLRLQRQTWAFQWIECHGPYVPTT